MVSKDFANKARIQENLASVPESGSSGKSSTAYMYQEISVTGTDQHPVQSVEMQINDTVERMSNTGDSARRSKINNHEVTKSTGGNANQGQDQDNVDNSSANNSSPATLTCGLKVEKPKLPRFSGDVRDYFIFRADFKYAIDSRYNKRDAVSLLRTRETTGAGYNNWFTEILDMSRMLLCKILLILLLLYVMEKMPGFVICFTL